MPQYNKAELGRKATEKNNEENMRAEYDIETLNPRKNPYVNKLKNGVDENEARKYIRIENR